MIKLYNTRTKTKELFTPLTDNLVQMYACGPTVYHYVHIGNMRTFLLSDILKRTLIHAGYRVKHVMNITDVGHLTDDADQGMDKMEKGASREGKTAWEVAQFYTDAFLADARAVNLIKPDILCKATDHIPEQISQVTALLENGHAYETPDGIYFDTTTIDDYGAMANIANQKLEAGTRVDMGYKKNPHDFALWKFSALDEQRQMEWDAFGKKGFPGWHIECSAMSMKYLGEQFDIHLGGIDLLPVHHTNEIAQAETITHKKPWVNVWLHGAFINIESGEKMSKSDDNFLRIQTIVDAKISPLAFRYLTLQTHYRKEMQFSMQALEAAAQGLKNLYNTIRQLGTIASKEKNPEWQKAFDDAIYDDLNMPQALAVTFEMLKSTLSNEEKVALIVDFDSVLGLDLMDNAHAPVSIPAQVQILIDARAKARTEKNWQESDKLRDQIAALGFEVKDTNEGQEVFPQ